VISLVLLGYLVSLVGRTDWFSRAAAVGVDVAVFVAGLCFFGIFLSILATRFEGKYHWLPLVVLSLNVLLSLVYLALGVFGKFGSFGPKA
jgi:hypothetical protein